MKKNLTLGYNVVNQGQIDNCQLGSICVSVIFRPVPEISIKSGKLFVYVFFVRLFFLFSGIGILIYDSI